MLLLAVWGSLNLVFVSGDLFTLYVALELLTFAGVPMVCLDGSGETLRAALRYLLFALLGSMLYLLGTVMLYGAYGTLDIPLLATRVHAEPVAWAAAALMTTGLLAKTALFPLHLWLPPAHAGAPAAASAVLSALVVKGSFFLVVRLWFDVMPGVVSFRYAGRRGDPIRQRRRAAAGAIEASDRLFHLGADWLPLLDVPARLRSSRLNTSRRRRFDRRHSAGDFARYREGVHVHGRRTHLRRAGPRSRRWIGRPWTRLADERAHVALAGVALIGVPPSGASLAKTLLLQAATETEQWWWAFVVHAAVC
jgi:NADH:ubiquinone oxidoreductase subunit 5 (subunit L)/multisubunit Na+/H+ antiporter MnhA subunit